eukprot:2809272-Prymnesium_polylepis.1
MVTASSNVSGSAQCRGSTRMPKKGTMRFWLIENGTLPEGLHQGMTARRACRTSIPFERSGGRTPAIVNRTSS